MQTHDTPEKDYNLERLVFFSDGVFAIVITLLVIELHPPHGWDGTFLSLLAERWRAFTAFAVSFFVTGAFWNAHRMTFSRITAFRPGLVFFNLLVLFFVVLIPFSAELIFDHGPSGEPFAIYLGLVSCVAVAQALLWGYAAFVGRVVSQSMALQARAAILTAMLVFPTLTAYACLQASTPGSSPLTWIWVLPVMFVVGRWRRAALRGPKPKAA